jgi:hypothetical protein
MTGPDRGRMRVALLPVGCLLMIGGFVAEAAAQMENPLEILAVRVREQGLACDMPLKAERDQEASRPLSTVWFLQCSNASYRLVLTPNMAAQIELLN